MKSILDDTQAYKQILEADNNFVKNRNTLEVLDQMIDTIKLKLSSNKAYRSLQESTSSSSTIGGILSDIVKLINKLIQVLKNKRLEWKVAVVSKDLVEVMDKIKKKHTNIVNIDESSDVMDDYKDVYSLAFIRIKELNSLFIQLVKSSKSAGLVVGGSRGANSINLFYAEALRR